MKNIAIIFFIPSIYSYNKKAEKTEYRGTSSSRTE